MNKNNKINQEEDVVDFQPSLDFLAEQTNANELSKEEYELLKEELESYFSRSRSFYELPKNNEEIVWEKPHVTRTKEELFAQLRFYDTLREKEKLSESQLKEIDREVIQIKKELLTISNYEYFLKTGHEKLRIDKTDFGECSIKFFQRENLDCDDLAMNHISINLPLEKWWIKNNEEILEHFDEGLDLPYEFVDINCKNNSKTKPNIDIQLNTQVSVDKPTVEFEAVEKEKQLNNIFSKPTVDSKPSFWNQIFKKKKDESDKKIKTSEDKKKMSKQKTETSNNNNSTSKPISQPTSRFAPPPPPPTINNAKGFNNLPPPSPNSFVNSLNRNQPNVPPNFTPFPTKQNTQSIQTNQSNQVQQQKRFFDYQQR